MTKKISAFEFFSNFAENKVEKINTSPGRDKTPREQLGADAGRLAASWGEGDVLGHVVEVARAMASGEMAWPDVQRAVRVVRATSNPPRDRALTDEYREHALPYLATANRQRMELVAGAIHTMLGQGETAQSRMEAAQAIVGDVARRITDGLVACYAAAQASASANVKGKAKVAA